MQSNMMSNIDPSNLLSPFNICECDNAADYSGDFNPEPNLSHPCFTHYGCPFEMSHSRQQQQSEQSSKNNFGNGTSRIPTRGAARPRLSPRINQSFRPVFHERANAEDAALLTNTLWKQARKSGNLSLTNKGMARVPERLYDINDADEDSKTANLEALTLNEEDAWWNQQPLNNLDLSSNALTHISPKIENLNTLTVLQLHDNALVALPPQIGKLEKLVRLNLSHNKLRELPPDLFSLPELRHLNISHNEFIELDPDISNLHMLEFLDASNNNIKSLPGGIGFLVRLTALLLPNNHIKELPPDIVNMRSLQKLDLMKNDLVALPEDMGLLRKLQCLYVQHNDIKELPSFEGNESLNELHASNNFIEQVPKDLCANLPHLKIFDLRDNKISEIPDEVHLLRNLTRLDVTNNSIHQLPVALAHLAHLVSLQVEGNPIKSIRRDIIQCGTTRILKTLQERAQAKDRQGGGAEAQTCPAAVECQAQSELPAGNVDNYRHHQHVAPVQANYNIECQRQFQSQYFMQMQQQEEQQLPLQQQPPQCPVYYGQFTHQAEHLNSQASQFQFDPQAAQFNSQVTQFNPYSQMPGCGPYMPEQPNQLNYRQSYAHSQLLPPHILPQREPNYSACAVQSRWVYKLRHTRTLAVNLEGLTQVPDQVFEVAAAENVHVVDFARNQLKQLPNGLQLMSKLVTELVLSQNAIVVVQPFISQFTRISYLNLSNNLLTDLPHEFGVLNTLRELNIGNNRLTFIPKALYELQGLEILLANDNHITALNVAGLENMGRLNTLDLRNNDIESIPAILGNLTNIKHLELIGNPFRQPRHQILMKGTDAIMSYLRDRIPT
ncbi:leucine-rich repeat-containing protein 40 isoform X1 [Drosophila albomicans]|uniref:Leucine-rich repeat-containing protein 40 isoform X1 n=1 Tax=Drosophila albomicans TaxID=7291 RepID=A0A6P8XKU7_DROAB|nr:leucine-rich repeat-containing protein 40 isoform X1 [Drosophila albomicans]